MSTVNVNDAHHHDEHPREQGRDGHGDVHQVGLDAEVLLHVGRDVERGLGKQPERDHAHDHAEQQLVVALEGDGLAIAGGSGDGTHV